MKSIPESPAAFLKATKSYIEDGDNENPHTGAIQLEIPYRKSKRSSHNNKYNRMRSHNLTKPYITSTQTFSPSISAENDNVLLEPFDNIQPIHTGDQNKNKMTTPKRARHSVELYPLCSIKEDKSNRITFINHKSRKNSICLLQSTASNGSIENDCIVTLEDDDDSTISMDGIYDSEQPDFDPKYKRTQFNLYDDSDISIAPDSGNSSNDEFPSTLQKQQLCPNNFEQRMFEIQQQMQHLQHLAIIQQQQIQQQMQQLMASMNDLRSSMQQQVLHDNNGINGNDENKIMSQCPLDGRNSKSSQKPSNNQRNDDKQNNDENKENSGGDNHDHSGNGLGRDQNDGNGDKDRDDDEKKDDDKNNKKTK
eukprot:212957_1